VKLIHNGAFDGALLDAALPIQATVTPAH